MSDNAGASDLRALLYRVYERVLIPTAPIDDATLIARGKLIDLLVLSTEREMLLVAAELKAATALAAMSPAGRA